MGGTCTARDARQTPVRKRCTKSRLTDRSRVVVTRSDSREVRGAIALSPDGKWMLETVAGVRRAAFVSLDFTDGMTRLLSSSAKP